MSSGFEISCQELPALGDDTPAEVTESIELEKVDECIEIHPFEARAIFFRMCQDAGPLEVPSEGRLSTLCLRCPPRRCRLEVNGKEIELDQETSVPLKQERPGCFICMDSLKFYGELHLEVLCNAERIMHASLKPVQFSDNSTSTSKEFKSKQSLSWQLECWLSTFATCPGGFIEDAPLDIELNVVGQYERQPIYLAQTCQADFRSKRPRRVSHKQQRSNLHAIAENDKEDDPILQEPTSTQEAELPLWDPSVFDPNMFERTYQRLGGEGVEENGQITFFNAGLRVGMGIGLGMCLGMGIGIGILTRTYQRTRERVSNLALNRMLL